VSNGCVVFVPMTKSVQAIYDAVRDTLDDDAAGALVEYGLLIALIALVGIVAMKRLDTRLTSEFSKTSKDFRLRLVPLPIGPGLSAAFRRFFAPGLGISEQKHD
jgi:Flp pilus assembly pilin Flp